MAANGASMRPVSTGELSDNLDVAWGPGPSILAQSAGNENYYDLDPDTVSARRLVPDSPDRLP
jgi:hypothetical protein